MKASILSRVFLPLFAGGLVMHPAPAGAQCQVDTFAVDPEAVDVAIDGDTLAVASIHSFDVRLVDIYFRQAGTWALQDVISQPVNPDGDYAWVLALSGDTLAIGAPTDHDVGGQIFVGKVYVYQRSGGAWSLAQELAPDPPSSPVGFGGALALEGDTLVIGEYYNPFTTQAGKVHVYARQGASWTEEAVLSASDPGPYDGFGSALALKGDTLMVGAMQSWIPVPVGPGKVYVFERTGSAWSETQRLLAGDPVVYGAFGAALAFDGDTLAVGAARSAGGPQACVYAFVESAGLWSQETKLTLPANASAVHIALFGERLLVGAPWDDDAGSPQAGAVHVFQRTAGVWSHGDKLYGDDTDDTDTFGAHVDWKGGLALVHASARGSVYLFTFGDPDCPVADFAGSPTEGSAPLPVAFTDQSSGLVSEWNWSFGDGASSAVQHLNHTFSSPGAYTVSLVARGPSGVSREIKVDYILAHTAASATVRNGSGVNRLCLASTSLPVLGGTWTAEIDASTHPGAVSALLLGYARPRAGILLPYGEMLLDVASVRIFASVVVPDGLGIGRFSISIPNDLALDGMLVYSQGGILGGGIELCNALDLAAGF